MHWFDLFLLGSYFVAIVAIGAHFGRRQTGTEAFFVGNRKMGAGHIGLSVVATDVGGGFSIGLGGLGFAMGISGSWLLFTGLCGAWMAAVIVIPRVKPLGDTHGWTSFPQFLGHRFDERVRLVAALVSALGYAAFVGAQILAGAKLASVTFGLSVPIAVLAMAVVIIGYTALGGLEAVVFTDTIQWLVLLIGLALVALPAAISEAGGISEMVDKLPPGHLSLALDWSTALSWFVTIVPIWFIGNTLYQRMFATRDVATAKRAWYLAGLLEWPLMAMLGTLLGMCARVLYPTAEAEMGLPLVIRDVLPIGAVGVVLAVYFSAIMSTADSCLLASVGHVVTDLYRGTWKPQASEKSLLRLSRVSTVVIGAASCSIALALPRVLDAVLMSYSFMVAGLFVPTLAGLLWPRATARAALVSMLGGGLSVIVLQIRPQLLPTAWSGINATLLSIFLALILLVGTTLSQQRPPEVSSR